MQVPEAANPREKDLDVDRETENLSMGRLGEKPVTLRDGGK
jgi:hypothetical protein